MGSRLRVAALWFCGVVCGACAVTLVSAYDEPTDRAVTALQATVDSFLITLARDAQAPACTYDRHKTFYISALTDISSLEVRNRARPLNDATTEQIGLLNGSLVLLERLHKGKGTAACMSAEEIEPLRRGFNSTFTAILTFELAKQRGN